MKLIPLPAWLGPDNLKAFAKGAARGTAALAKGVAMGATGTTGMQGKNWLSGSTNPANTYATDFAQRIGKKIKNAVGAGNVDTDPSAPLKPAGRPWEWTPKPGPAGTGYFRSGNTRQIYVRTPGSSGASWKKPASGTTPAVDYGTNTSHARGLEQKWSEFVGKEADAAVGDMPDLSETRYHRLNALFEQILQEVAPQKHSIASMLLNLIKISVGTATPLDATEQAAIAKQCMVAQKKFADPASFNKALFNLGKLLYSFVIKKSQQFSFLKWCFFRGKINKYMRSI